MNRRRKGIRGVLITTYLLTMGIALIIGFSIFNEINVKIQAKKDYITNIENTRTFMNLLDLFLDKSIYVSLEIAINEEVQKLLADKKLVDEEQISKILIECISSNEAIQSIHIADTFGNVISEYSTPPDRKHSVHFLSQFNISKINEKQGREYIGIGKNYISGELENTLYIGRSIRSKENLEHLGYLFIYLSPRYIEEISQNYLERMNLEVILVAPESSNYLIFAESEKLAEKYAGYIAGTLTQLEKNKWEDNYAHVQIEYNRLGMRLISTMRQASRDDTWINILLIVTLVNFIFLCIIIVILGKKVVYPLENIALKTKSITEEGDLGMRFKVDEAYDEVGLISEALNEMLTKMGNLLLEVKEKEKMQRILELSVINHQVNPHFLYNTLNSVGMLISMEDKENAQKLIGSLSKYYRACLNQEDFNTVEQELIILKEYINIMLIKNPSLLNITYNIDEELRGQKLPRMILQTLVENSIKYGIKTMDEPLEIQIEMQRDIDNQRMIVIVRDNGKGMEEEIRASILGEEKLINKSGFGLRSTIKRLKLMNPVAEVKDIMEINTKLNEYMEVKIYIPTRDILKQESTTMQAIYEAVQL